VALARVAFDRGLAARQAGELPAACEAFREAVSILPVWPLAQFEFAQCVRLITPVASWNACMPDPRVSDAPAAGPVGPRPFAAEPVADTRCPTGALTAGDLLRSALAEAGSGVASPAVRIEVARLHEDAGDHRAAHAAYADAHAAFPAEIRALEGLARTAPVAAGGVEARATLEAWLARSPYDVAALWQLAEVCEALGDIPAAESAWIRFADRAVARPRAVALLAAFADRTGSRAALERARKLSAAERKREGQSRRARDRGGRVEDAGEEAPAPPQKRTRRRGGRTGEDRTP
jgi:tetratricopeptide (TPR) repeat protein